MSDPLLRKHESAGPLFEPPAVSNVERLSTSTQAWRKSMGRAESRRHRILKFIRAHGTAAIFEVAAHLGIEDYRLSGRFSELVTDGLIEKTGRRRRRPRTNCDAEVYQLTAAGVEALNTL